MIWQNFEWLAPLNAQLLGFRTWDIHRLEPTKRDFAVTCEALCSLKAYKEQTYQARLLTSHLLNTKYIGQICYTARHWSTQH